MKTKTRIRLVGALMLFVCFAFFGCGDGGGGGTGGSDRTTATNNLTASGLSIAGADTRLMLRETAMSPTKWRFRLEWGPSRSGSPRRTNTV